MNVGIILVPMLMVYIFCLPLRGTVIGIVCCPVQFQATIVGILYFLTKAPGETSSNEVDEEQCIAIVQDSADLTTLSMSYIVVEFS